MLFFFFRCNQCDKVYNSESGFNKHIKKHHSTAPVKITKSLTCDICKKKFSSKIGIHRHMTVHTMERTKIDNPHTQFIAENFDMTCDLCEAVFISFHDARSHYKDAHMEKKGYIKCCKTKLRELWIVTDHINSHLNPGNFK